MELSDIIKTFIIPVLFGGVSGAALNLWFNNRKQKMDVTLSVIKHFFSLHEDIGKVRGLFTVSDLSKELQNIETAQRFYRIGNWYNYVVNIIEANVVIIDLLDRVGVTYNTSANLDHELS